MSAVVEAVTNVFEAAVDVVSSVFETVGEVVESVVEFTGRALDTVAEVVYDVIQDPLPTLLAIGGQMIGIPAPVTMAAITAARGGSLEDIALSAGTAYFAPQVGSALTSTFSSTLIEAGVNETLSEVVSSSVSKGLVNGTVAEIKGGSFGDAFAGGFTGGMVSGGVSEVGSYIKDDVIQLAQDSGMDLKDANSLYNAGAKAVSTGLTSEITGQNDFSTSFANSIVGSSIDMGTRAANATIDEQFNSTAQAWDDESRKKDVPPVDLEITGAGIPDELVTQVSVSETGTDTAAIGSTIDMADVISQTSTETPPALEAATSDISVLPSDTAPAATPVAVAPEAQSTIDFADLIASSEPISDDTILPEDDGQEQLPESVADIAEEFPVISEVTPEDESEVAPEIPSTFDLADISAPKTVVSEAPISEDLLTAGLAQEPPVGGLNAAAQQTPEAKMAESQGLKATDFTKPMVATVGSLLKSTLRQGKKPVARAPMARPTGGLQAVKTPPKMISAPPKQMDVSKLIPIQKAPVAKKKVAPAQTLAATANLSPVSNIAGLTSLVKKAG